MIPSEATITQAFNNLLVIMVSNGVNLDHHNISMFKSVFTAGYYKGFSEGNKEDNI